MKYIYQNYQRFHTSLYHSILIYLSILVLFLFFRIVLFMLIGGFEKTGYNIYELALALHTGFRFDSMAALAGMTPLILLTYTELLAPASKTITTIRLTAFRIITPALLTIYIIIALINIYFYQFFQSHLNILLFGFFQDDTTALLFAIWEDYPALWILAGIVLSAFLFSYFTGKILNSSPPFSFKNKALNIITPFIILFFVIIGIRGSLSDNPLRMDATTITNNDNINALVCNGIYALKDAISAKNKSRITVDINVALQKAGFVSLDELESFYCHKNTDLVNQEGCPRFFENTPKNAFLEANPPNVIFILAESMSSYYMSLHNSDQFNLLGQLEDVLPECLVFERFLASTPSTIGSVENLMVNTVQFPLSQSPYLNVSLNTSVAKPFADAGYNTSFITGGDLGWRNMGSFVKLQHFQKVNGYAAIKQAVSFNDKHQYGAYDEYLYDYLYTELQSNLNKPNFIFTLTISNHTPYTIPKHYKPYPLVINDEFKSRMRTDTEYATRSLLSFQYANDCLGRLIKRIKKGPLGENTIIAITGDHNIRKILDFPNENLLQKHGVPFILYIPEKYKTATDKLQTLNFGSHKDIFPTLYNISLSNATVLKSGANLLSASESLTNFAVSEFNIFMSHEGCVVSGERDQFYIWENKEKTRLQPVDGSHSDNLKFLLKKGKSHAAAMDIAVQENLTNK